VNQPVSFVPVQQNRPLQLRPPTTTVAVPHTRPPVVAIHAQQQIQTVATAPAQSIPVVAIHAQAPPQNLIVPVQTTKVPNYSYSYAVKDATTGDEKSHEETRTGDDVVGRYTVVEPDGTLRTVTYTAGINGFNAIVERTPGYAPPNAPVKVVTVAKPVAVSTPTFVRPIQAAAPSYPVYPTYPNYPTGFHFGG